jgi:hypothetical protein
MSERFELGNLKVRRYDLEKLEIDMRIILKGVRVKNNRLF